ncbi:unnamed protein product [Mucor fragilis]
MEKKIQCIVAPNEADAQLTHLAKTGKVDAVVTEDSDLLAFGCPKVIYKIDRFGDGIEICMDKVINDYKSTLYEYDAETIRHICILSGCDYLPSIKGVGLKTILKRYEINKNTDQALYNLQHQFRKYFPEDYIEKFYFANLGFLHQWVYDMDEKNYVRLNPLTSECSQDDIKLLGRIPTVQDSTMFRVNKVIPKPKDSPLKESITEEFLAYAESSKENIVPSHLGSPFSASSPTSPKSPKSPTSSKSPTSPMGMRSRQVLSESKSPQHNSNTIAATDSWTAAPGEASSYLSRSKAATQGERLEALYKRFGVLPRKSQPATSGSTAPSLDITKGSPYTSLPTDNKKPTSSESGTGTASSQGIGKALLGTNIGSAANLPTFYSQDRDSWMSYIKQKSTPPPPPSLGSTMKRLYQHINSKTNTPQSPLSSPLGSPASLSPSVEQPLMSLTEASTTATPTTLADSLEPTHDYPISPPQTSPTEDEMPSSHITMDACGSATSLDNTSTNIRRVSHDISSQYPPLSPPTITSSKHSTTPYNQHTQTKPMATTPSDYTFPNAYTNHSTSTAASSSKEDLFIGSQYKSASESAKSVNTTPLSDYIPPNAHINHSTSNKEATTTIKSPQDGSGKENRKRSFNQTKHSASATLANSPKKCFPALPPPPKRRYRRH